MVNHMKTTLDLPDDLLMEAKTIAVQRRTTLKAMVEHALRREIRGHETGQNATNIHFSLDESGLPVMKKSGQRVVSNEMIYDLQDEE